MRIFSIVAALALAALLYFAIADRSSVVALMGEDAAQDSPDAEAIESPQPEASAPASELVQVVVQTLFERAWQK